MLTCLMSVSTASCRSETTAIRGHPHLSVLLILREISLALAVLTVGENLCLQPGLAGIVP